MNIKAVKIGSTIGLIVTLAVGSTLAMFFLAPGITPVLLAQSIAAVTGFNSVLTPALAVKSLVLSLSSGLLSGLATKEVVHWVLRKNIVEPTNQTPANIAPTA